jgi:hypothetical protein
MTGYNAIGEISSLLVLGDGESGLFGGPSRLEIKSQGKVREYRFPYREFPRFGQTFEELKGRARKYSFQLEKSGELFILLPGTRAVTTNLPAQPPGFPVEPKEL